VVPVQHLIHNPLSIHERRDGERPVTLVTVDVNPQV